MVVCPALVTRCVPLCPSLVAGRRSACQFRRMRAHRHGVSVRRGDKPGRLSRRVPVYPSTLYSPVRVSHSESSEPFTFDGNPSSTQCHKHQHYRRETQRAHRLERSTYCGQRAPRTPATQARTQRIRTPALPHSTSPPHSHHRLGRCRRQGATTGELSWTQPSMQTQRSYPSPLARPPFPHPSATWNGRQATRLRPAPATTAIRTTSSLTLAMPCQRSLRSPSDSVPLPAILWEPRDQAVRVMTMMTKMATTIPPTSSGVPPPPPPQDGQRRRPMAAMTSSVHPTSIPAGLARAPMQATPQVVPLATAAMLAQVAR